MSELVPISTKDVSTTLLKKEFEGYLPKIEKLGKAIGAMTIEDEETMGIAEQRLSEIHGVLKAIEDDRKTLKEPFFKAGKTIDTYVKTFISKPEELKKIAKKKISTYKSIQAKIEEEKARKEAEELAKQQAIEKANAKRLHNINKKLHVILFGGAIKGKDGEIKTFESCDSRSKLESYLSMLEKSFPNFEDFGKDLELEAMKIKEFHKDNAEKKKQLFDLMISKDDEETKNGIIREMEQIKTFSESKVLELEQELTGKVESTFKSKEKAINSTLENTMKGLTQRVEFNVADFSKVSDSFKEICTKAINEYIRSNRQEIIENCKNEKYTMDSAPGLIFSVVNDVRTR